MGVASGKGNGAPRRHVEITGNFADFHRAVISSVSGVDGDNEATEQL